MNKNVTLSAVLIVLAIVVVGGLLYFSGRDDDAPETTDAAPAISDQLVRDDSAVLSSGDEAVFVEFLDFECEACISLFPVIEQLRAEYGDRVSFVVRHMSLHGNSLNAAKAAEAAGEQGEFEQMYTRLFESPEQWGHKDESQEDVFASYAEDMGLDMQRYREDLADPAIAERIEQSLQDGKDVGVEGTPTFFLNGEQLEPETVDDLKRSFDDALAD